MDATVAALLAPGKGLLAADESFPTIAQRFEEIGLPSTADNRRAYRELLFTTPGLAAFISGVILFDETLRQRTTAGEPLPELLNRLGLIPGIKVDTGTVALPNFPGEKMTQGLDGLRDRLIEYHQLGARFTKWRAVLAIGKDQPSPACLATNARALALFAALSQEAGLVPIVEPEILMDGAHSLAQCEAVTRATLETVFAALATHRVRLEHLLLKTNMVLAGDSCPAPAGLAEVAAATVRCLRRSVPPAVPGIVFLSGGQSAEAATARLRAICAEPRPAWTLSFSFGRALQTPALLAWRGQPGNLPAAQAALQQCAQANSLALEGGKAGDGES